MDVYTLIVPGTLYVKRVPLGIKFFFFFGAIEGKNPSVNQALLIQVCLINSLFFILHFDIYVNLHYLVKAIYGIK